MHKATTEDLEKALLKAVPGKVWKAFWRVSVRVSWGFRRVSKVFPRCLDKKACQQTLLFTAQEPLRGGFPAHSNAPIIILTPWYVVVWGRFVEEGGRGGLGSRILTGAVWSPS